MRLGISFTLPHRSPEEWADAHAALGCRAVTFPLDHTAPAAEIDAYAEAARARDLLIAEVGAWSNPMSPDPAIRDKARAHCVHQLELAEYVGARCCVNIAGAVGAQWDGGYTANYAPETFDGIVECVRGFLDAVRPTKTTYTLEPMPNMPPDSPDAILALLAAVDRPAFAVHLDVVNMINCPARYFDNAGFLEECFAKLGGRIRCCHVKDIIIEQRLTFHLSETPPGTGALDLARYVRLADAADPEMPMLIEHLPDEAAYRKAFAYVSAL